LERGVSIVAPVHDAVIVESPDWEIDDAVAETQAAMAEASAVILDGFQLRSDAKIVRWPDRYMDGRGREFWNRVMGLMNGCASAVGSDRNCPGIGPELSGDRTGIVTPV
jgi:hypothetical protein